jgi:Tfp pilus assembly protein PilO
MYTNWKENYQRYKKLFQKNYEYLHEREELRNYIEIALSLLAISFFSIFAIRPTAIAIIEVNKKIKTKEETIQKMDLKIKNLQKVQSFLDQEVLTVDILEKSVPDSPQAEEMLDSLNKIANLSNLTVKNISAQDIILFGPDQKRKASNPQLPEEISTFSLSASFVGQFLNLNNFLSKLESFVRPLELKQLSITKVQETNKETESLNLVITAEVPYYQIKTSSTK